MNRIAPIANLDLVSIAMSKLINRQDGLPGLGVYYGPSGYGKTTTIVAVANETRAYYVQMRSAWGKKALLEKIAFEMGMRPAATVSANLDLICEQMSTSQRPLILDEADHAASRPGMVELLRDIYEGSQAPLMLVGEEMLPSKLKKFERFHGRVLAWVPAQPVTMSDALKLKDIYSPDIAIADDLLAYVVDLAHGSVRRLCVNLVNIQEHAMLNGLDAIDRATWGTQPLYTGDAPRRV
ncbi:MULTISPECIES: AAA family ATPase [Aquitalea]|uniref:DNA transposition protein n=1 Tax=Aquitalea magnusonii TaxID=332411 RepID=A0A3G9GGH1_9NEIS|nr:ATP-binding protein [Aquitalea magnusonii]BBF85729.1 DNA transposition protein [Aquitalea magnusonii]